MKKLPVLFLLFLIFLAGCGQKSVVEPVRVATVQKKRTMPEWYTHPPRNDEKMFYGAGSGRTPEEAQKAAMADLKKRLSAEVTSVYAVKIKKFKRYLKGTGHGRPENRLDTLPAGSYEIIESQRLDDSHWSVLIGARRSDVAKPLKKAVVRRLVPIEESWHRVRSSNVLIRYRTARAARRKMVGLLPDYLLASSIEPFSKRMKNRIEGAIPYFSRIEKSLRNRLRFCMEPAKTPALELFSKAVEKALKKEKIPVVSRNDTNSDTICIQVDGKLSHHSTADMHMLRASIDLKLREPYKKIIEKRHYVVNGTSSQSGSKALERATKALEERVSRTLHLSE